MTAYKRCSSRTADVLRALSYSAVAFAWTSGSVQAQMTERVSLGQGGVQGNADTSMPPPGRFLSSDGRFVAFMDLASNLVPGDANNTWDIFVRDRANETTELVSVDSAGNQGNGPSGAYGISITPDGRYVAFESASNNLVPGDSNGAREVFLRDRQNSTTERIALDSSGNEAAGPSFYPSISADGRYVAFTSPADNIVPGDTNGHWDTFVRDRQMGTTERISVSSTGTEGDNDSYKAEISADGRFVVFESLASNLVAGDTNGTWDVFIHDRQTGVTEIVGISTAGVQGNFGSGHAAISSDGRFVAFESMSTNLVASDTNGCVDVFLRDRLNGTTELASVSTAGAQAVSDCASPSISADGRFVVFGSSAGNLVPGDTNNSGDVFIRDTVNHTTERATLTTSGTQVSTAGSGSISADGRFVLFMSTGSDVVPGDTNGHTDIFIRDRFYTHFTSICDAGVDNVIDCPCANPPAGSGSGCDNSSGTGGAVLAASGSCHLATDSLTFTTSGEKPSATSVVLQGNALATTGVLLGQGVRCAGGLLKRLYIKSAVGGSITAPELGSGDPTVSARAAAVGDPIQAGEMRWYLVYYRDPIVLGGCYPTSTFNCTQTGQVLWWP